MTKKLRRPSTSMSLAVASLAAALLLVGGCDAFTSSARKVQRADKAVQSGDYQAAIIDLKSVLKGQPTDAEAHRLLAEASYQVGDFDTARSEIDKAIRNGVPAGRLAALNGELHLVTNQAPQLLALIEAGKLGADEPLASTLKGRALLATGKADAALQAFQSALTKDPNYTRARVGVAETRLAANDVDGALKLLADAAQSAPQAYEAVLLQGRVLAMRGRYQEAEPLLQRAVKDAPVSWPVTTRGVALSTLVDTQLSLRKVPEAAATAATLAKVLPGSGYALFANARVALAQKDFSRGIADLQRFVSAAPDNLRARMLLGAAQSAQGNLQQAETELEAVIAAAPENIEARKLLAQVRLRQKKPGEAAKLLAPVMNAAVEDAELYALLGVAEIESGDPVRGVEALEKGVAARPDDPNRKLDLAAGYIAAGRADAALQLLQTTGSDPASPRREALLIQAQEISRGVPAARALLEKLVAEKPSDVNLLVLAAQWLLSKQAVADALTYASRAVDAAPKDPRPLVLLAQVHAAAGRASDSRSALERAMKLDPADTRVRIMLAAQLLAGKDTAGAIRLLQAGRSQSPKDTVVRLALAKLLFQDGKATDAQKVVDEIVAIAPRDPGVASNLGNLLMEAKQIDQALAQHRRAADLAPKDPVHWLNIARAQIAENQPQAAIDSLNRSLAIRPNWPPAVAALVGMDMLQKKPEQAVERVRKLRADQPGSREFAVLEGDVHLRQQRFADALRAYEDAAKIKFDAPLALRLYQARRAGRLEAPEAPLQRWLQQAPGDGPVRLQLADYFLSEKRYPLAAAEYEKLARQYPKSSEILNNLAWVYSQQQDPRAGALAKSAHEMQPDNPMIADTYGWILFNQKDVTGALPVLAAAAKGAPDSAEVQYHYAAALAAAGQNAEALAALKKVQASRQQFPDRSAAEQLLARLQP